jgi:hypothetical protein
MFLRLLECWLLQNTCQITFVLQATEMMHGVSKPARLYRLDVNLWSTSPKPGSSATGTATTSTNDAVLEPNSSLNEESAVPEVATAGDSETEATQAGPHLTDRFYCMSDVCLLTATTSCSCIGFMQCPIVPVLCVLACQIPGCEPQYATRIRIKVY